MVHRTQWLEAKDVARFKARLIDEGVAKDSAQMIAPTGDQCGSYVGNIESRARSRGYGAEFERVAERFEV